MRNVSNSELAHLDGGWTVYRSPRTSAVAGGGCKRWSGCCTRHPRACQHRRLPPAELPPPQHKAELVLREDLFLSNVPGTSEPTAMRTDPVAVVRAYEACIAPKVAAAQLSATRNTTRTMQAQLAMAPLPMVAVIFFGSHYERLTLLRGYEHYFAHVVYMSPNAGIHDALRQSRPQTKVHPHRAMAPASYRCKHGLKVTYACVADIGAAHAAWAAGVLFFHFDMWIKPWDLLRPRIGKIEKGWHDERDDTRLLPHKAAAAELMRSRALLHSIWTLPAGRIMMKKGGPTQLLPLECFNVSSRATYRDPYPHWTWDRDVPDAHAAVRRVCAADGVARGACSPDRLCLGWADLYYVPTRYMPQFGRLARVFGRHASNAELAVPTMLRILREGSLRRPAAVRAADRFLESEVDVAVEPAYRPRCWGFCCSQTTCPELLTRHACGHRMSLEAPRVRDALRALLIPPV